MSLLPRETLIKTEIIPFKVPGILYQAESLTQFEMMGVDERFLYQETVLKAYQIFNSYLKSKSEIYNSSNTKGIPPLYLNPKLSDFGLRVYSTYSNSIIESGVKTFIQPELVKLLKSQAKSEIKIEGRGAFAKELAVLFNAKTLIHEYVHFCISKNSSSYKSDQNEIRFAGHLTSGFSRTKHIFDSTVDKNEKHVINTNLDEAITEFMAIYIVCRQNKMDFNQLGVFQFFTQGNGYKSIALKVYQFYNKLNPTLAKEFVEKILPTAKLVGSPLLILQFIRLNYNENITLNKLRELDFD